MRGLCRNGEGVDSFYCFSSKKTVTLINLQERKTYCLRSACYRSGILQTRMDQRRDLMKMNFEIFQIQKWMLQSSKSRWKMESFCLVFFFLDWFMVFKVPKIVHLLQICAYLSKISKSIKAFYLYLSERHGHVLLENSIFYRGLSNSS